MKLCIGMIDAGKAYNAANKQFVNGIRELAQQSTKDEVIEVNNLARLLEIFVSFYCNYRYEFPFSCDSF